MSHGQARARSTPRATISSVGSPVISLNASHEMPTEASAPVSASRLPSDIISGSHTTKARVPNVRSTSSDASSAPSPVTMRPGTVN